MKRKPQHREHAEGTKGDDATFPFKGASRALSCRSRHDDHSRSRLSAVGTCASVRSVLLVLCFFFSDLFPTYLPRLTVCTTRRFCVVRSALEKQVRLSSPYLLIAIQTRKSRRCPVTTFRYACRLYFALFSLHTLIARGKK